MSRVSPVNLKVGVKARITGSRNVWILLGNIRPRNAANRLAGHYLVEGIVNENQRPIGFIQGTIGGVPAGDSQCISRIPLALKCSRIILNSRSRHWGKPVINVVTIANLIIGPPANNG